MPQWSSRSQASASADRCPPSDHRASLTPSPFRLSPLFFRLSPLLLPSLPCGERRERQRAERGECDGGLVFASLTPSLFRLSPAGRDASVSEQRGAAVGVRADPPPPAGVRFAHSFSFPSLPCGERRERQRAERGASGGGCTLRDCGAEHPLCSSLRSSRLSRKRARRCGVRFAHSFSFPSLPCGERRERQRAERGEWDGGATPFARTPEGTMTDSR